MAGVKFVDKDTVVENVLSNTTGFLPMWQDNGALKVPVSMLRMQAVASCTSAAGTVAKSATISNMPDFELRNGLIITVAFTNGNSASSPTLNINEKGAWPLRCEGQASSVTIGDGCWSAGALITVQYVEVDSSHKYFLMLGHNVASVNSVTGITTRADGTQVCSTTALNSALNNFTKTKDLDFSIDFPAGTIGTRGVQKQWDMTQISNLTRVISFSIIYIEDSSVFIPIVFSSGNTVYLNAYRCTSSAVSPKGVRVRITYI